MDSKESGHAMAFHELNPLDRIKLSELKKEKFQKNKEAILEQKSIEPVKEVVKVSKQEISPVIETPKKLKNSKVKYKSDLKKIDENDLVLVSLKITKREFEFFQNYGTAERENASAGSGIKKSLQEFFEMKKREKYQIEKMVKILKAIHFAFQKMDKAKSIFEKDEIENELLQLSNNFCSLFSLFSFEKNILKNEIPSELHKDVDYAFARIDRYLVEKKYANYRFEN